MNVNNVHSFEKITKRNSEKNIKKENINSKNGQLKKETNGHEEKEIHEKRNIIVPKHEIPRTRKEP